MKKINLLITVLCIGLCSALSSSAQNIYTFAGISGPAGYSGDGGYSTMAMLFGPSGIQTDTAGNVYFCDSRNNVIRKVTTAGMISTIAGNGTAGYSGDAGPAIAASLNRPAGLAIDMMGNIFFSDAGNNVIRMINGAGMINTVAGDGTAGYSGDGGSALTAQLRGPAGLVITPNHMIIFADSRNNVIRMIDSAGTINTIAGDGTAGYIGDGGPAGLAEFSRPSGVVAGPGRKLYIADARNNVVRMIDSMGMIHTYAGNGTSGYSGDGGSATAANLHTPGSLFLDMMGNLYIGDSSNTVRVVHPNDTIATFAGTGVAGYSGDGGPATLAKFTLVNGITMDHLGNMYISTFGNNVIRRIGTPVSGISITSNYGDTLCYGLAFQFTATVVADTTPHYQWQLNGANVGTDTSVYIPATMLVTGDTVVCILYDTVGGVPMVISNKLIVDSLSRTGTITCPAVICVGNTVNVNHFGAGGPGGPVGIWSLSNSTIATLTPPPPSNRLTAVDTGYETIYYALTNMCGTDSAMLTVHLVNNLYGTISGPSKICANSTETYMDTTSGGIWRSRPPFAGTIDSMTGVFNAGPAGGGVIIQYGHPGCWVSDTVQIFNLSPIMGPGQLCIGGVALYMDTPATPGSWSISASAMGTINSTTGDFTAGTTSGGVTITYGVSADCYVTQDVVIRQIGAINGPNAVCAMSNASFTDTAMGGMWSVVSGSGTIVPTSGVYTAGMTGPVVINYSLLPGCSVNTSITIDTLPYVAPITGATTVDSIWSITLTDGTTGGYWLSSNTAIGKVDSMTGVVTGVSAGVVTITYAIANSLGCVGYVTHLDTVINAAGVVNVKNNANFGIYPNPASSTLNLTWNMLNPGITHVQIADMTGKKVAEYHVNMNTSTGRTSLDISTLTNGVYMITVQSETGFYCTKLTVAH